MGYFGLWELCIMFCLCPPFGVSFVVVLFVQILPKAKSSSFAVQDVSLIFRYSLYPFLLFVFFQGSIDTIDRSCQKIKK